MSTLASKHSYFDISASPVLPRSVGTETESHRMTLYSKTQSESASDGRHGVPTAGQALVNILTASLSSVEKAS